MPLHAHAQHWPPGPGGSVSVPMYIPAAVAFFGDTCVAFNECSRSVHSYIQEQEEYEREGIFTAITC